MRRDQLRERERTVVAVFISVVVTEAQMCAVGQRKLELLHIFHRDFACIGHAPDSKGLKRGTRCEKVVRMNLHAGAAPFLARPLLNDLQIEKLSLDHGFRSRLAMMTRPRTRHPDFASRDCRHIAWRKTPNRALKLERRA